MRSDPIGIQGGIHLYVYVLNNPINSVDPFGLDPYSYKPNVGDLLGAINDFLSFYGVANLTNRMSGELRDLMDTIPCGEKRKAHVCVHRGPPPWGPSSGLGEDVLHAPDEICIIVVIVGTKDCCE